MAVCPSCMTEGWAPDVACPGCGHTGAAPGPRAVPELELDVPAPPPRAAPPKKRVVEEPLKLELAIDIEAMHSTPPPPRLGSVPAAPPSGTHAKVGGVAPSVPVRMPSGPARAPHAVAEPAEDDLEVRALADYGEPPKVWLLSPVYAYRVFTRQRELRKALAGRREEAEQAKAAVDDALVAAAERVRPRAAKDPTYKPLVSAVSVAEEVVRSRDGALAKEQDAHAERLAAIDARITKLEQELAAAQAEERRVATEVAEVEAALQRAEAKAKRAEIEIRNATAAREQAAKGQAP